MRKKILAGLVAFLMVFGVLLIYAAGTATITIELSSLYPKRV